MLGSDLMKVLNQFACAGFTRRDLDITNENAVMSALKGFDVVVNAAAYTAVDSAEVERDIAFAVNAEGPRNIARACAEHGQRLVHVSTDYVFDGKSSTPYPESHSTNPESVYGASKAQGESYIQEELGDSSIIVRTAWLYGGSGGNFVKTILELSRSHDTITVVNDQIGQPTWSLDLAKLIRSILESPVRSGIFHGTNSGQTSWFDFAKKIFSHAGLQSERILACTSESFSRPAPRPAWSVLSHEGWGQKNLPSPRAWDVAFSDAWETTFSIHYAGLIEDSGR